MSENVIICADDYGQNLDISRGIQNLVKLERINAISCMVNTEFWQQASSEALDLACAKGLHFNLTHGQALSEAWIKHYGENLHNLSWILKQTYLGLLKQEIVLDEISAQFARFSAGMKKLPDFIDGHQHIQQFPIIREVLIKFLKHNNLSNVWVRSTCGFKELISNKFVPKVWLLALLGGNKFKKLLQKHQILHNQNFYGIYNFKYYQNFPQYFQGFLRLAKSGDVIMCHPGLLSTDTKDPLYLSRVHEYQYLLNTK